MIILAHRGFWIQPEEKNSKAAFDRSFENEFGVETDIRDSAGRIFISHDMAKGTEMTIEEFLKLYHSYSAPFPLALNVKADGLFKTMADLLQNKSPLKKFNSYLDGFHFYNGNMGAHH